MIIIGYQGIGKTSLSKNGNGYIDLESGSFWVDGKRHDDWHIPYCNIAENLSDQGYRVFVSSHESVREQLRNSCQRKIIVYPAPHLRDAWIWRLEKRHNESQSEKDYKALANAKESYAGNIQKLMWEEGFEKVMITELPYDLEELLERKLLKSEVAAGQ